MPNYTYARSQGRNRFGRRYRGRYVTKGYLKAIIGTPEAKYADTPALTGPTPAADTMTAPGLGNVLALNDFIVPGTGAIAERIGNQVTNKSLHVRLDMARVNVDSLMRVIIFWAVDGATEDPTNLLENNTSGFAYASPINKDYGKSFWVRYDRTYTLAAGQTQLVVDEIWRKLKCTTEWDTEVPQTVTRNTLYIAFISDQPLVANQPTFKFYARLNYMDT